MEQKASEEEVSDREVLVILAMSEMTGSLSVIETLTALGRFDIIKEAKAMAEMEKEELSEESDFGGTEYLDDPEVDDIADALGEDDDEGTGE